MKIKLCRIFNVFNKNTVVYSVAFLFATLIVGFVNNNFGYVLLVPVFGILYCLNFSKFLKVENETITYKDFQILSNLGKGKKFKYISNEITVKVSKIEFKQNVIERFFNAGHIDFVEEESLCKHSIYGIARFNIKKQEIENRLKQL